MCGIYDMGMWAFSVLFFQLFYEFEYFVMKSWGAILHSQRAPPFIAFSRCTNVPRGPRGHVNDRTREGHSASYTNRDT